MSFDDLSAKNNLRPSEHSSQDAPPGSPNFCADKLRIIEQRGYELLGHSVEPVRNSEVFFLRHKASGTRAVLVQNSDPHLRIEIRFLTLPDDSSGVFHYLEHALITESKTYPKAFAFDEATRSLFLKSANAVTHPDYTRYFATGIDRAAVEVLGSCCIDATLKGAPSSVSFYRERGHYKPTQSKAAGFDFSGVVYQEMLGVYGDASRWIDDAMCRAIFQDGPYSHYAGGEPTCILDLSEEKSIEAYKKFYSTVQASICYYGNVTIQEKLDFIDRALESHPQSGEITELPIPQPRAERSSTVLIPVDPEKESGRYNQSIKIAWKCTTPLDYQEKFELTVLINFLVNGWTSPLRRELVRAGFKGQLQNPEFREAGHETAFILTFAEIIPDNLALETDAIQRALSSLNSADFNSDEVESTLKALSAAWIQSRTDADNGAEILEKAQENSLRARYQLDPLSVVERAEIMRDKLQRGEKLLEQLFSKFVASNQDRTILTVIPTDTAQKESERTLEQKIADNVGCLSEEDLQRVNRIATEVAELNQLALSNSLKGSGPKSELDQRLRQGRDIAIQSFDHDGATITYQCQPTLGQSEVSIRFDVSDLSIEQLSTLEFFGCICRSIGPDSYAPGKYYQDTNSCCSGLSFSFESVAMERPYGFRPEQFRTFFILKTRVATTDQEKLMTLLSQGLLDYNFGNYGAISSLVDGMISGTRQNLDDPTNIFWHGSRRIASLSSSFGDSQYAQSGEYWIKNLERIKSMLKVDPAKFQAEMGAIHRAVFQKERMIASVTAEEEGWIHFAPRLIQFTDSFLAGKKPDATKIASKPAVQIGVTARLKTNYVHCSTPVASVVTAEVAQLAHKILDRYLHVTVRMLEGAYGASSYYLEETGRAVFMSWRDRHIVSTLKAFKDAAAWLKSNVNDELLHRAKIARLSQLEQPMSPFDLGKKAVMRSISGYTINDANNARAAIFDATVDDVLRYAAALERALELELTAVIYGGHEALANASKELSGFTIVNRI